MQIRELEMKEAQQLAKKYWFEILLSGITAFVIVWKHSFIFEATNGGVLTASVVSMLLSFTLASFFLRRQGIGIEREFLALASMVSGIWLFEVLYHYGYPYTVSASNIIAGLSTLNFNTDNGQTFPLLWSLIMIALPLFGLKYMAISKTLIAVSVAAFGAYVFWIGAGYPQWIAPQWWPAQAPSISLIPLTLAHTSNPLIVFWGLVLNSASKLVVILPAFLFNKKQ